MRSVTLRPLAGVALLAVFAPMPGAAQLQCNAGTAFDPMWVSCQGSYTQIVGETDVALQEYLDLMQTQTKNSWYVYPESEVLFEEAFLVVSDWDLDAYQGRTNFNDDGTVQGDPHGPFGAYGKDPLTLNFLSPYTGVFVVVLKGGTRFSMYLFNTNLVITQLQFDMSGTWAGGSGDADDALSHADLWGGTKTTVPEPSSLLLLGSGLLGLGIVGYRRRRK